MEFQAIYKEYFPRIVRYLTRVLNDKDLAEDFTQEVFIRVNENLNTFEGRSKLSTWIYKIATNIANDYFKSSVFQKAKKQALASEFLEENQEVKYDWATDKNEISDQIMEKKEMNNCIRRYVQEISENYRTVFVLSEYEGLKNQEIADILSLTLDNVKIRLYRARTQLKKKMKEGCRISYDDNGIYCDEI